jgi:hypothetical protein
LSGTDQLYRQYQLEKETAWKNRKEQLTAIWDKQKTLISLTAASAKVNFPKNIPYHVKHELRLQAQNAANARIAEIRREMSQARSAINARNKMPGYIDWLKREAENGNIPAIYALRKRGAAAPALVNMTARDLRDTRLIAAKIAHVSGRGTLFYKVGQDVFRDNGSHVSLKRDVSDAGVLSALRIAMVKFNNQPLAVNGTDAFKSRCIEIATREAIPITFSDPDMERTRQSRIQGAQSRFVRGEPAPSCKNGKSHEPSKPADEKPHGPER